MKSNGTYFPRACVGYEVVIVKVFGTFDSPYLTTWEPPLQGLPCKFCQKVALSKAIPLH